MFTGSLAFRFVLFLARLFEARRRPRHRRELSASLHPAAAVRIAAAVAAAGLASSSTVSLADPDEASACSTCNAADEDDGWMGDS